MMGIFTGKPFLFDGKNHGFRLRFSLKPTHWLIVSSIHFFPELPGPDPSAMLESDDPFNLRRFSDRHRTSYGKALEEMKAGQKKSHWIWFVFPGFASGSSVSNCSCFFFKIFLWTDLLNDVFFWLFLVFMVPPMQIPGSQHRHMWRMAWSVVHPRTNFLRSALMRKLWPSCIFRRTGWTCERTIWRSWRCSNSSWNWGGNLRLWSGRMRRRSEVP